MLLAGVWFVLLGLAFIGLLMSSKSNLVDAVVVYEDAGTCDLVIARAGVWYAVVQPYGIKLPMGTRFTGLLNRKGVSEVNSSGGAVNVLRTGITSEEANRVLIAECVLNADPDPDDVAGVR
jgi:hypothetical protein